MPKMRCVGCMEAGIVVFMDSVLCGECFFRQTVVARAVRGSFDRTVGRPPLPVAKAPEADGLVGRAITRLQRDLNDLLSVLATPDPVVQAPRGSLAPTGKPRRLRRRIADVPLDAATSPATPDGGSTSSRP